MLNDLSVTITLLTEKIRFTHHGSGSVILEEVHVRQMLPVRHVSRILIQEYSSAVMPGLARMQQSVKEQFGNVDDKVCSARHLNEHIHMHEVMNVEEHGQASYVLLEASPRSTFMTLPFF